MSYQPAKKAVERKKLEFRAYGPFWALDKMLAVVDQSEKIVVQAGSGENDRSVIIYVEH